MAPIPKAAKARLRHRGCLVVLDDFPHRILILLIRPVPMVGPGGRLRDRGRVRLLLKELPRELLLLLPEGPRRVVPFCICKDLQCFGASDFLRTREGRD